MQINQFTAYLVEIGIEEEEIRFKEKEARNGARVKQAGMYTDELGTKRLDPAELSVENLPEAYKNESGTWRLDPDEPLDGTQKK